MAYKIFIITIPLAGHINPVLATIKSLLKKDFQIVVYSTKKFEKKILECNVEYRSLNNAKCDTIRFKDTSKTLSELIPVLLDQFLDIFDGSFAQMLKDIISECPDLVMYDGMAYYAKWIINYLIENKHKKVLDGLVVNKLPKVAVFVTSFFSLAGVYPNDLEMRIKYQCGWLGKIDIKLKNWKMLPKINRLSAKYGFDFASHMQKEMYKYGSPNILNIVFTFPEFQPRYELFDASTVKFIGQCIDDDFRLNGLNEPQHQIEVDNVLKSIRQKKKIIYVSLGTLFNDKINVYKILIKAFGSDRLLKKNNVFAIVATGSPGYENLTELVDKGRFELPDNVKLVDTVHQLRVLEHTDVMVTHCGFNSVMEAINFGVPMMCLPISADQPLVSHRVATELQMGIQLNIKKLKENLVADAIEKLLNDEKYKKNCLKYSELSRKYDGTENMSEEIFKYLDCSTKE
jgi:UDP:flavonoid glycosyltransferase YjiC (YdhE family)